MGAACRLTVVLTRVYGTYTSDCCFEKAVVAQRVDTQVTSTSASVTATSAASGDEGVEMEDKI